MPRIINGEIVPDNDPRINQVERREPSSPSLFDQLQEPVTVFGYTTAKQNVLLAIGAIGLFGGFQLAAVAALVLYFGSNNQPPSSQVDPRTRSVQYATTQGTQTFTNNDSKKPGNSASSFSSGMPPQTPKKEFKKVGNITTLN